MSLNDLLIVGPIHHLDAKFAQTIKRRPIEQARLDIFCIVLTAMRCQLGHSTTLTDSCSSLHKCCWYSFKYRVQQRRASFVS